MSHSLFVLFNHTLTAEQEADAGVSLGADRYVEPPASIRALWADVPPELPDLVAYLEPVKEWLKGHAHPGDPVLIQGDFGATWLMVRFAFELGLIPVYSTTRRLAAEELQPDGSVTLTHRFRHVRFRTYGINSFAR